MEFGQDEIKLTVHGLDVDASRVRADIFAEKLRQLVKALQQADSFQNRGRKYNVLIADLKVASASALLRESQFKKARRVVRPGILVGHVADAIQSGNPNLSEFPKNIVASLRNVAKASGDQFAHAEATFYGHNVVRFDTFFEHRASRAIEMIEKPEVENLRWFEGVVFSEFDGTIKQLDSRGNVFRGKVVLSINGAEIDCVFNRQDIEEISAAFEKRCVIRGRAIYEGDSPLPARIQVRSVRVLRSGADLAKWRGELIPPEPNASWTH